MIRFCNITVTLAFAYIVQASLRLNGPGVAGLYFLLGVAYLLLYLPAVKRLLASCLGSSWKWLWVMGVVGLGLSSFWMIYGYVVDVNVKAYSQYSDILQICLTVQNLLLTGLFLFLLSLIPIRKICRGDELADFWGFISRWCKLFLLVSFGLGLSFSILGEEGSGGFFFLTASILIFF
ncbi:hypothetical protein JYU15_00260 [bacterium AH-315-I18]|nr:hypothetical protein [bacterium AH-315-I18]